MTRVRRLAASTWLQVLLTFVLALAGAAATHRLWQVDLTIPFEYQGDGLQYLTYAKSIHDHGWMLETGSLGAPFGLLMYDWPEGGWLSLVALRLFDQLTGNFVLADHLLYLLGYPLAALACPWALRRHVVRSVSRNARVELRNEREIGREVEAGFVLESASERRRTFEVEWPDGVIESLALDAEPLAHRRHFALPGGRSHICLRELAGSAGGGLTLLDLAVVDSSLASLLPDAP